MKAIIIFILSVLALTGCTTTKQETVDHKPSSVELVQPDSQPVNPPHVVHSPEVKLHNERVSVETTAKPVTPALVEVPALAQAVAPILPEVQLATIAQAPYCEEDQPCWDCSTMGNRICGPVQQYDSYSGNPIVDCAAQGMLTAEDYSCVPASFYAPASSKPASSAPVAPAADYRPDLEDSMQPVPPASKPVVAPKPPAQAPVVVPPSQPSAPVVEATSDCDSFKSLGKTIRDKVQKTLTKHGLRSH